AQVPNPQWGILFHGPERFAVRALLQDEVFKRFLRQILNRHFSFLLGAVDSLDHTPKLFEFIGVGLYNIGLHQGMYRVTGKQGGLAGLRYASPLQPAEQVVRVRYRSIHFVCGDQLPINPPGSYRMNNATDSKLRRSRPAQKVLYVGLQRVLRML